MVAAEDKSEDEDAREIESKNIVIKHKSPIKADPDGDSDNENVEKTESVISSVQSGSVVDKPKPRNRARRTGKKAALEPAEPAE